MRRALAVALAALAAAAAAPAAAQVERSVEFGGARLSVTEREIKALTELGSTLSGSSAGAQDAALAKARREANGPDALYWLALLELELGRRRGDDAMRSAALDRLIPSPLTQGERLASYLDVRGGIAFRARDFATAKAHWARLLAMRPDDPDVLANLAQVHVALGDTAGAEALLARSVARREASGKKPPAAVYRQRLVMVQKSGPAGAAAAAGRALVEAYPTPGHWREALVVYRQLAAPREGAEIELFRLMRSVGALAKAEEYLRMAQLLRIAGQAAEAKAVLGEGLARGLLQAGTSPTREIIAEVERALARTPAAAAEAPAAAGLRLGRAHLLAGRREEASAAFGAAAAAGGIYGELAQFWLLRLAEPGAR